MSREQLISEISNIPPTLSEFGVSALKRTGTSSQEALTWLDWCHNRRDVRVTSCDVPGGVLPQGCAVTIHDVKVGGDKGSQCTESATDAAQLASVYQHNGQWKRAEAACLHAISNLETLHGASNPQALRLWGNVSESRMSRGAYGLAVRDLAHIVAMTGLQYGPESLELIAPLQNLCKAFVLARRWQQAIAALSRAQAISVKRNGAEHCDTERLEKVFQSLHRQATGSAVRSSDPERL